MRNNFSFVYTIEEVDVIVDRVWNWKYLKPHQKITPKQVVATGLDGWGDIRDYVGQRWGCEMTATGLKMRSNKLYQKIQKFRREFVPGSDTVWRVNFNGAYQPIGHVVSSNREGAANTAFTMYGWALAGTESTMRPEMFEAAWVGVGGWEEARKRNVDIASDIQMRITRWERELLNTQKNIDQARSRAMALLTVGEGLESREEPQS